MKLWYEVISDLFVNLAAGWFRAIELSYCGWVKEKEGKMENACGKWEEKLLECGYESGKG